MEISEAMEKVASSAASMSDWEKKAIDLFSNDEQRKMTALAALHSMGNAVKFLRSVGMVFKVELVEEKTEALSKSPPSSPISRRYSRKDDK